MHNIDTLLKIAVPLLATAERSKVLVANTVLRKADAPSSEFTCLGLFWNVLPVRVIVPAEL